MDFDFVNILFSDKWLPISIVVISPIVALIIDLIFSIVLKSFVGKTKTTLDDKIIDILHQPIFYSLIFIGWMVAISKTPFNYSHYIISLLLTFIIIIWGKAIFKAFIQLIKWYSKRANKNNVFQQRTLPLFDNLGKLAIFLLGVFFIFKGWGWDVTGWLASAGVIGIVIGLAAKDTLANFFSGIFIMADAPYKENDYINLDSGERGYVTNIGLRSTRLLTRDDIEITIPNSVIANSKIINESGGPREEERVRISVGVAYGSDIDKVREILINIAKDNDNVSKTNIPRVRFRTFGESSINFQLLFWIPKPEMRGRVSDAINTQIYKTFNQENIEIPFPQRTVHIKKDNE
tara:strand:+ start:121 stop:1164 length:1044 start_codon:yes stop_codon:yes gene_type:complete